MAWKVEKLYGPGQAAAEKAAVEAASAAKHQAAIKSLADCACCDCGIFGPWGDGEFRYCEEHVPHDLKYAATAFEKRKREQSDG